MPRIRIDGDNPVTQTLLIPLYARALESREPAPLVKDPKAAELVERLDCDFSRFRLHHHDQVLTIIRVREFDRQAREFLTRHPEAAVVHIGCGLDTRFERVDNGSVQWYDLDLPEVIALRRQLLDEAGRHHLVGCSILDESCWDFIRAARGMPVLFVAEGVLPYFHEAQVRQLFLAIMTRYPGAELVCDAMTPLMVRLDNLAFVKWKMKARLHWGLSRGRDPERWAPGIRLIGEWFYFDSPEPRLGAAQLMRHIPATAKGAGIFHYRLGDAPKTG